MYWIYASVLAICAAALCIVGKVDLAYNFAVGVFFMTVFATFIEFIKTEVK